MEVRPVQIWAVFLFLWLCPARAAVFYVDVNSTNPTPPYTNWSTASTDIQSAIDVAGDGDLIMVTNGVYQVGSTISSDGTANRVAVNHMLTLESVNGSGATIVDGGHTMRCVYLTNGTVLTGFTLTNGYSENGDGGGVYCTSTNALIFNCVMASNSASVGGGAYSGTLSNCTLTGNVCSNKFGAGGGASWSVMNNCFLGMNWATYGGGGASQCTLNNCFLSGNSANLGGGAAGSTLNNCTVSNNMAVTGPGIPLGNPGEGGGAYVSILQNCLLVSNAAVHTMRSFGTSGGGAYGSTLINCTLQGNSADSGGGVSYSGSGWLNGCTLTGNWAYFSGGGFYAPVFDVVPASTNCVFSGNWSGSGGGAYNGTWINCIINGNWATNNGGGAFGCYLYNCTVCLNSATNQGGGSWGSVIVNSIIYYNTAAVGPNVENSSGANNCTWPDLNLEGSTGDITNEPLLVNLATGDFHLQSNSPCINAGLNNIASASDFDGNLRIAGGTVDIGAYEYQLPVSMISYAWLDQYGLPITTNIDTSDSDGTGMNNWQKWIAGLNPTNPASVLAMLPVANTNDSGGITVSWDSVNNRLYFLQSSTNLAAQPVFSTIQSGIAGQAGTTSFTDTTATNGGPYFYRVGVQ